MSMRSGLVSAVILLAVSRVLAEDYEIRMTRPAKVGDKYEMIASGARTEKVTMLVGGKVAKADGRSMTAKLEATVTVQEIDSLKREKKINLVVSKCVAATEGAANEEEVLRKGAQVVAQLQGKEKEFLVDGEAASKDIAGILDLFISFPTTPTTDDDIFGTKERKKVGDSWPVNKAKAVEDLSDEGMSVKAEDIKGSTKLEKLAVVDGVQCLHLSAKLDIGKLSAPLPPGMAIEKAAMTATFEGDFPLDVSKDCLSQGMTMTMSMIAKGKPSPDAPEMTLSTKREETRKMKRKDLK